MGRRALGSKANKAEKGPGWRVEWTGMKAEVILSVKVRFSGGIKDVDQAKHLARMVVESGSFAEAGLRGPGTHEYGEEESEDLITLEDVKSGGVTFASLYK
jgi:hypothetical protein